MPRIVAALRAPGKRQRGTFYSAEPKVIASTSAIDAGMAHSTNRNSALVFDPPSAWPPLGAARQVAALCGKATAATPADAAISGMKIT